MGLAGARRYEELDVNSVSPALYIVIIPNPSAVA